MGRDSAGDAMEATSQKRFAGKVAVVTGSTDGIGLATVERLGKEGASVVVSSRKMDNVSAALSRLRSQGIDAVGITCNVSKAEDRARLAAFVKEQFSGRLDILVLNAAVSVHYGPMMDTSERAWDKIFDVNVKAAFFCVSEMLPLMSSGGSITFVSSITGYEPEQQIGAYSVTKTALLGLTKVLASELAPRGIRVNAVAPGIIRTRFSESLDEAKVLKGIPMGRYGTPDEAAAAIAYSVSSDATFMTGECLVVAGGARSRL